MIIGHLLVPYIMKITRRMNWTSYPKRATLRVNSQEVM